MKKRKIKIKTDEEWLAILNNKENLEKEVGTILFCPWCGKKFNKLRIKHIICGRKCYFEIWRRAKREIFNAQVRPHSEKSMNKLYKIREKAGLCLSCGKCKPAINKKTNKVLKCCKQCLDRRSLASKIKYAKSKIKYAKEKN